jgi:RimJ/RimL family protein N-acetyltransferase
LPTPATLVRLDARWAAEYGVAPAFWCLGRVDVAPRAGDADWAGLFVFARGGGAVVQAPPAWGAEAARLVAGRPPEALLDPAFWAGTLGARFARAVGPAWLGYADEGDFRPAPAHGARLLGAADEPALRALAAAAGAIAWEHSGIEYGREPIWGVFADDVLAAAAGIEVWSGGLGHLGVVTHPAYRGRGLATAVASSATRDGLARGLVMQYRTLTANGPSMAVGRKLGYVAYATTLAVRLAGAEG